jgi:hypothetical protein
LRSDARGTDTRTCVQEWQSQVGSFATVSHDPDDPMVEDQAYEVELWTNSGAQADLDVSSSFITGLDCDTGSGYEICSFTATADETVKLYVNGGQTAATYTLQFEMLPQD